MGTGISTIKEEIKNDISSIQDKISTDISAIRSGQEEFEEKTMDKLEML
jgi:hypothetical protein